jgi:UDP-N-acetylglucosamine acyltransferase
MSQIHPTAIVDPGASLGADVEIGPFSIVGPDVTLAAGVRLMSHVVIEGVTTIGEGCVVHPFANLGGPPQHLGHKGEKTELVLGPRNIIREHVTMHTGTASGKGVTRRWARTASTWSARTSPTTARSATMW